MPATLSFQTPLRGVEWSGLPVDYNGRIVGTWEVDMDGVAIVTLTDPATIATLDAYNRLLQNVTASMRAFCPGQVKH